MLTLSVNVPKKFNSALCFNHIHFAGHGSDGSVYSRLCDAHPFRECAKKLNSALCCNHIHFAGHGSNGTVDSGLCDAHPFRECAKNLNSALCCNHIHFAGHGSDGTVDSRLCDAHPFRECAPFISTLHCAVIISTSQVMAQMGLWTAGFVMLTLLVNGPLISPLIRWLGLSKVSAAKKQVCM